MPCYNGWSRWMEFWMATLFQHPVPTATLPRRWQVMIWAGILESEMEGPSRVPEGVKMTFDPGGRVGSTPRGWRR